MGRDGLFHIRKTATAETTTSEAELSSMPRSSPWPPSSASTSCTRFHRPLCMSHSHPACTTRLPLHPFCSTRHCTPSTHPHCSRDMAASNSSSDSATTAVPSNLATITAPKDPSLPTLTALFNSTSHPSAYKPSSSSYPCWPTLSTFTTSPPTRTSASRPSSHTSPTCCAPTQRRHCWSCCRSLTRSTAYACWWRVLRLDVSVGGASMWSCCTHSSSALAELQVRPIQRGVGEKREGRQQQPSQHGHGWEPSSGCG